jgi:hypothetical protein
MSAELARLLRERKLLRISVLREPMFPY